MTYPPRGTGDENSPGPWVPPSWVPQPTDNEPPPQYAWYPGQVGSPPYWSQTAARTDPLAVAALVLGLVSFVTCGLPGLVGAIFGIIALVRISGTHDQGRGMAVAGLTLSVVSAVGYLALFVYLGATVEEGEAGGAESPVATASATASSAFVDDLRPGDCIDGTDPEELDSVAVVPCANVHDGEVYAVFDLKDGKWPGDNELSAEAGDGCTNRQEAYVDPLDLPGDVSYTWVEPSVESWSDGDRRVVCWFESTGEPLTGSVRD